tara:strand:+ start:6045 stop:6245 length:201 start_codon:yes stop_codon:yes gene_type:complete
MKAKVLKELPLNELSDLLISEKDKLLSLKLSHSVSPLENPQQIKFVRRNIARINTELASREINQEN